jgi:hypothetical protein
MCSNEKLCIPAVSFLLLLCAFSAPRAAAGVSSCTATYTCPSGVSACYLLNGGGPVSTRPVPGTFDSEAACTTYVINANPKGQSISCSCSSGAPAARSTTAAPAPGGLTPQQQLGMAIGKIGASMLQQGIHNLLYGNPAPPPDPEEQQRQVAAQQLNDSGIYLLKQRNYAGAINEFQQALAITPNDSNISGNLALAKQQLKDAGVAAQTSEALGQFLGNVPSNAGQFDFDQLTHSAVANPNASALSLVNLDGGVVDLRGATRTSPQSLASQLDEILSNKVPATTTSARSDVVLPQDKDIELLFDVIPPASARSNVVLPQDKDMELLFDAIPPASTRSNVDLPQDKDIELLFDAGPPASKPAPATGPPHN